MKTILLVIESKEFGQQVQNVLQKNNTVLLCHDANTASSLMQHKPDAMVIQIELPGTDGLTFLEKLSWKPAVILSLAVDYPPYTAQRLYDLGVGYFLRTPCTLHAVTERLQDMMRDQEYPHKDPQTIAAGHLTVLGISPKEDGGKQLRVGIPLYAQDTSQKLTGELYPTIAKICGTSAGGVEHQIRRTIQDAWQNRKAESWSDYFPRRKRCPSNGVFISTLAEKLWQD